MKAIYVDIHDSGNIKRKVKPLHFEDLGHEKMVWCDSILHANIMFKIVLTTSVYSSYQIWLTT
jgi:hypothetical protein